MGGFAFKFDTEETVHKNYVKLKLDCLLTVRDQLTLK